MTLQEIKDEVAPHLNLEELNSLLCFVERRIEDVKRFEGIRRRTQESLKVAASRVRQEDTNYIP